MIYQIPEPGEPLSQGDLLDDCPLFRLQADADLEASPTRWTARVVVLTQACDLAQAGEPAKFWSR